MGRFLTTETLVVELQLIVSLAAIAVRRLLIPYGELVTEVDAALESAPEDVKMESAPPAGG